MNELQQALQNLRTEYANVNKKDQVILEMRAKVLKMGMEKSENENLIKNVQEVMF